MNPMGSRYFPNPEDFSHVNENVEKTHTLILYNDDHNDYGFVIDCLVDICKHSKHQAEQCTLIAHHTGKCEVKKGVYLTLDGMRKDLILKGLNAEIVRNG